MGGKTYRIGEVAEMLHLKTYVLRFWETAFPQLAPVRTGKGQRLYSESDIELLQRIQLLLHVRGMTIDGAKRVLAGEQEPPPDSPDGADGFDGLESDNAGASARGVSRAAVALMRQELLALRALLTQTPRE